MDDLIYGISIEVLQEITGEELRAIKQWKKGTRKPSESAIRLINLFVHGKSPRPDRPALRVRPSPATAEPTDRSFQFPGEEGRCFF